MSKLWLNKSGWVVIFLTIVNCHVGFSLATSTNKVTNFLGWSMGCKQKKSLMNTMKYLKVWWVNHDHGIRL